MLYYQLAFAWTPGRVAFALVTANDDPLINKCPCINPFVNSRTERDTAFTKTRVEEEDKKRKWKSGSA